MRYILLLILLFVLIPTGYVRFSKGALSRWHVDPLTAVPGEKSNYFQMLPSGGQARSPVFPISTEKLAVEFDNLVMGEPNVTRFAGSPAELHVTYIQRSRRIGYPDYVSVRFIDCADGTSTLAVFSRARYGRSDFGVNRARVERWVKALGQAVSG
ncbi:MAG: DUF1499 domain-containing protein [Rhodobacteraceae bacterium]|nr:DUF1499 domain-containing protein [Paracoccaceae bacterium]